MPLNLDPTTFVKGGLLSDVDVEITSARFTSYDYNGRLNDAQQIVCALRLEYRPLTGPDGDSHVDYLSFGKMVDFVPTNEGKGVESPTGKTPLQDTVFFKFIESLRECGFDKQLLAAGDISVLEGMKVHIVRRPVPEQWKALASGRSKDEQAREKTYLAVSKIISMPGAKKGAAKPEAGAASDEVKLKVESALLDLAPELEGPVPVKSLQMMLLKKLVSEKPEVKRAATKMAADAEFLSSIGFAVEDGKVSFTGGDEVPF